MKPIVTTFLSMTALAVLATPVAAHPHDQDRLADLREKSQELADKAREQGDALLESELIMTLSEALEGLAARVEVEKGDGNGTAVWIDGDEILRFNGGEDTILSVTGVGKNLTIDREIILKDGKTRTRIVIEMDEGHDTQINVLPAPNVPE